MEARVGISMSIPKEFIRLLSEITEQMNYLQKSSIFIENNRIPKRIKE